MDCVIDDLPMCGVMDVCDEQQKLKTEKSGELLKSWVRKTRNGFILFIDDGGDSFKQYQ